MVSFTLSILVTIPESMIAPVAAEEMEEMELPTLEPMMEEEMPIEIPEEGMTPGAVRSNLTLVSEKLPGF